jgi:TolB-like protein
MTPHADEVRRQLDRLLASAGFANAGRMSRFLRFVVERTLAGDAERLKEYVIGVEVFDRDARYDPRVDAIVRVEAARLRAKLAEYYAGEGRADAVLLTLPKGGYAPVIKIAPPVGMTDGAATDGVAALATTARSAEGAAHSGAPRARLRPWLVGAVLAASATLAVAAWAPWTALQPDLRLLRVAVLPFTPYPDAANPAFDAVAMRITEGVTAELVRTGRFEVVASSAASAAAGAAARPRDLAATLAADLLVEARVTIDGDRVRVEARASNGAREQKLWVANFAADVADSKTLAGEIAAAIASAGALQEIVPADQYNGVFGSRPQSTRP